MSISMVFSSSAWMSLLNNYVIEVAFFDGGQIGILQNLREIPVFLAFTVILVILFISQQRLAYISMIVLGLGVFLTGFYPSAMGLYITTVIMSIGFHYLETELVYHESFKTKAQANEMIFEYIEIFYNRQRLHSYNYYMSPVEFEEKMLHKESCLEYNFICLI